MKLFVIAVILACTLNLYGSVKLSGNNGWFADIEIGSNNLKNMPILFLIYNNKDTNTEFILEPRTKSRIKLNLDDGVYNYVLSDPGKNIIEKGSLSLLPPFHSEIRDVAYDSIKLNLETKEIENFSIRLLKNTNCLFKADIQLNGSTNIELGGLSSGTHYKIEMSGRDFTLNREVETPLKNIALNKPVYGTFTKLPESRFVDDTTPAITRINDGRLEWYKGMAASGEMNLNDQYVFINLLKLVELKEIKIFWHARYYPLKYLFYFSSDGTNWSSIERKTNQFIHEIANDNSPMMLDDILTNLTASYIGVIVKKGEEIKNRLVLRNYLELLEIEAYE